MPKNNVYEIYAIRYGSMDQRVRGDNFISTDRYDQAMPIDYYVWLIKNDERSIVVDTGFDHTEAKGRGRELIHLPREGLAMLGVEAHKVEDVIVTHLHYDHAGTLDDFPAARFHLQEMEMNFATGRHMCQAPLAHAYSAEHVCQMVRKNFEGRVAWHNGSREIAPGISVHLIGGHTMGVQCVKVKTKRGDVVLASDAAHFYENIQKPSPFPIVHNVADMIDGFAKMRDLASSEHHIIPGHDPLVRQRYAAPSADLAGIVSRLDIDPTG